MPVLPFIFPPSNFQITLLKKELKAELFNIAQKSDFTIP